MKWELIVVAVFWLLYGPITIAILHSDFTLKLVMVLGIGIVLTIIFLIGILLLNHFKRKGEEEENEVPSEEKNPDELELETPLFTNVFKENFGRIEYDLN